MSALKKHKITERGLAGAWLHLEGSRLHGRLDLMHDICMTPFSVFVDFVSELMQTWLKQHGLMAVFQKKREV